VGAQYVESVWAIITSLVQKGSFPQIFSFLAFSGHIFGLKGLGHTKGGGFSTIILGESLNSYLKLSQPNYFCVHFWDQIVIYPRESYSVWGQHKLFLEGTLLSSH